MPAEFEKLVTKIKAKGSANNPYAVARSVLGSDAQILARRGTGQESKMAKKSKKLKPGDKLEKKFPDAKFPPKGKGKMPMGMNPFMKAMAKGKK